MSVSQQRELPSGEMIDEYEIQKTLGSGGFGITYLATDTRLQRQVAIKEYFPQNAWRDNTTKTVHAYDGEANNSYQIGLDRFFKEGQILAQFKHYNIVSVQRLVSANNTAYLIMDYVHGETLEKYLQRLGRPLTYEEAEQIFNPLLDGLKTVHEHNLLHLDIKPENIFLRQDSMPVLIDFGGARFQLGKTSKAVSFLVATEGYAPSEQYTAGNLLPATDIYAVAATLYRALTGDVPTDSQSRSLSMIDHAKDSLAPLEINLRNQTYPHHFIQAINRAISLRASERHQTAREFQLALFSDTQEVAKETEEPQAENISKSPPIQVFATSPHSSASTEKWNIWKPIMVVIGIAIVGLLAILAWNSNKQPNVITVSTPSESHSTSEESPKTENADITHQQQINNKRQTSLLAEELKETLQPKPPAITHQSVLVFDPPSNIRKKPEGDVACVINAQQTIHVIASPNTSDWYKTDACGSDYNDFIHRTQVKLQAEPSSLPPPKKSHISALIFDPPSNIRKEPEGEIACVMSTRRTINVIPLSSNTDWHKTNACGNGYNDFIHHTQIKIKPNVTSQKSKNSSQYIAIKQSKKTKVYRGKWQGTPSIIYIKWDDYSGSGGKISGVVESQNGNYITSFVGSNYAFRKLKLSLNNGDKIYVKATTNGNIKTWSSPEIKFSRKYK